MKHYEKENTPHAVYRFYDKEGMLLYVGLSANPGVRIMHHRNAKSWFTAVVRVTLEWYETWSDAARAEADAILSEKPNSNLSAFMPKQVGMEALKRASAIPKQDGYHCPRCGAEKERKAGVAYCRPCRLEYSKVYKLKRKQKEYLLSNT